jgi:hypothetical protein
MKQLYFLNEEEKNRILNLHESATKRQYLSEQSTAPVIVTNYDNAYEYKLENGQYTFRGKPGTKYAKNHPDWAVSKTPTGNTAIKNVIDTKGKQPTPVEPVKTTTDPTKVVTNTTVDPSKAATVTANTVQGTPTTTTDTTQKPTTDTTQVQGTPSTPNGGNGVVTMKSNDIFTTEETPTPIQK